jgi:hypothetical protein
MYSAARFTRAYVRASERPSCHASTIGNATSSICVLVHFSRPSTNEFWGTEPSGFCWVNSRKSSSRDAEARSPAASCAVATW